VYRGSLAVEPDGLGEIVAIKTIKPHAPQSFIISFLREIKILQSIENHTNIVRYFGSCCHNGTLRALKVGK